MKANAPEKLYLFDNPVSNEPDDRWLSKRSDENDVEYIRTDAFIEKALKFLNEKFYFNNLHYSIESGVFDSKEEMFEDFINYIKGE